MNPFTRFLMIGTAALVLVGLAAHTGANLIAGQGLVKELTLIRSRGEPITLDEAAPPAVPDTENAALVYHEAFQLFPSDQQDQRRRLTLISRFISSDPNKRKSVSIDEARAALTLMEPTLMLVRKAAVMPKCRFPVQWSKGYAAEFPHPSLMRDAVRYLAADARVKAYDGNGEGAVDDFKTMISVAHHMAMEPTLLDQLVVYVMLSTTQESLQAVMETVRLDASQLDWLHQRFSEFDVYDPYARTLETERCFGIMAFDQLQRNPAEVAALFGPYEQDGKPGKPPILVATKIPRFWSPLLKKDETFYLQSMARTIEQAQRGRQPESGNRALEVTKSPLYAQISRQLIEALPQTANKRDAAAARLGMSQWALALSLYQQKEGRYPASLAEDQAMIGWELPFDPFTGKSFLYQRNGEGYTLYSVGPNGRDDGGIHDKERWGETRDGEESNPASEGKDDIAWQFRSAA